MRCLRGRLESNRIRVKVGICRFEDDPGGAANFDFQEFTALVDTGALRTCVTQNVVDRLQLARWGRIPVGNVKRTEMHWTYMFRVCIWPETYDGVPPRPFGIGGEPFGIGGEIEGIDVGDSRYYDVLLGMNIISRGSLHLELDGSFELAFPG
jgi:hypothetical protein